MTRWLRAAAMLGLLATAGLAGSADTACAQSCRGSAPSSCHHCSCETFRVCGPNNTNCHNETICRWAQRRDCR